MDSHLLREYRSIRLKHPHYPAKVCLAIARGLLKYRYLPDEWEQDGFDIKVSSDYDEDGDLSYFGKFVDRSRLSYKDADKAIDRWARDYGERHDGKIEPYFFEDPSAFISTREYRYVVPEADYASERRAFLDCKMGKREADERAREVIKWQVKCLETYTSTWWFINVDVKVSKEGIVLGRASIGGTESGLGDYEDPIRMIAEEHGLVDEALDEAKAMVERLCMVRS